MVIGHNTPVQKNPGLRLCSITVGELRLGDSIRLAPVFLRQNTAWAFAQLLQIKPGSEIVGFTTNEINNIEITGKLMLVMDLLTWAAAQLLQTWPSSGAPGELDSKSGPSYDLCVPIPPDSQP